MIRRSRSRSEWRKLGRAGDVRRDAHLARRRSCSCTIASTGRSAGRCSARSPASRSSAAASTCSRTSWCRSRRSTAPRTSCASRTSISRRRHWYWKTKFRRAFWLVIFLTIVFVIAMCGRRRHGRSRPAGTSSATWAARRRSDGRVLRHDLVFFLFFINLLILFGPLFFFSIQQIKGYEPGDADWGVKLDDVRGQAEAKEEIRRVVSLWQSGEEFEKAGGKRERGVLFLGPPGTGKTMLSKAIATSFNCPFVTIPGSGFAADVHRHGRADRALHGAQGQEARRQVGRPVHRVHRRDRRRRHAPRVARLRLPAARDAARSTTRSSSARWAR